MVLLLIFSLVLSGTVFCAPQGNSRIKLGGYLPVEKDTAYKPEIDLLVPEEEWSNELRQDRQVCRCGTLRGSKIVGGSYVPKGQIPWQVGLGSGTVGSFRLFCGGSLISDKYVITAAHCVQNSDLHVKVLLGDVLLSSQTSQVVGVTMIQRHESYNSRTFQNDIAVMTLAASVSFSRNVFPVCLPRQLTTDTFVGQKMVASGWGTTREGSLVMSTSLNSVVVTGISNEQCNTDYPNKITSGMLCAREAGRDTCQGDSGGPLTYTSSSVTYLVGVVSWGIGCAKPAQPGVYIRVTKYLKWIDTKTGGPLCSK